MQLLSIVNRVNFTASGESFSVLLYFLLKSISVLHHCVAVSLFDALRAICGNFDSKVGFNSSSSIS